MAGKKPEPNSPPWMPSKPVRALLQTVVAAALAGFGAYGFWRGHFRLPMPARRHILHHEMLRFDGDSARLMSAGSLVLALVLMIVMVRQLGAPSGVKTDQTVPTVLATVGFVMAAGVYWANVLHLV